MLNQKILRIIGIAFLVIGAIFLIISFAGITGYSIFIGREHSSGAYVAIWFFLVGSVLIEMSGITLEHRIHGITPKKELVELTDKERAFRRKLINLFDKEKPVLPRKIAYLLPRYDRVKNTGEYVGGTIIQFI